MKGKVFWLRGMHWVSLSPPYYTDDTHCWHVINVEKASVVLDFSQAYLVGDSVINLHCWE
jgi:hypothetical protein